MQISVSIQGTTQADAVAKLTAALAETLDPANAAAVAADVLHFADDPQSGFLLAVDMSVATIVGEDGKVVSAGTAASIQMVPIAT
jgi:hypothetical protein